MVKRKLIFSFGSLNDEDKAWDVKYWQSVSTEERFRIAHKMVADAFKFKTGEQVPEHIDKLHIVSGSYKND